MRQCDRRQVLLAIAGAGLTARGTKAAPAASRKPSGRALLIPRKLLFGDPEKSAVTISPDGTRIAYLAPVDGVLNLWVGPIDDVAKGRSYTKVTDRNLGPWLVWLP